MPWSTPANLGQEENYLPSKPSSNLLCRKLEAWLELDVCTSRRAIQMSARTICRRRFYPEDIENSAVRTAKVTRRPRIFANREELRYFSHVRKRLRMSSRHSKSGQRHSKKHGNNLLGPRRELSCSNLSAFDSTC